jgi:hypothetical protein
VCGVMTCWREMCTCHILMKAVNWIEWVRHWVYTLFFAHKILRRDDQTAVLKTAMVLRY